ncbi:AEC family transporter [Lactonifactor longoviformis]|uniref:AEC family transporter n=1 Tax=Lactonifactor longoviformis TaxID=341220 RepID=UPI0036F1D0C2
MSFSLVLGQMVMIFILMMIGFFFFKQKLVSEQAAKDISVMVVNLCSPVLLISSVSRESSVTQHNVLVFTIVTVLSFAVLILLGHLISALLLVPKPRKSDYMMMTIFGNVGFIGIPVVSGLLGQDALIYVAIYNLAFNILIYTYGIYIIRKDMEGEQGGFRLKSCINPGTIASLITIIIFWFHIPVPNVAAQLLNYAGQPATFLSLFVIGTSLAQMNLREVVSDVRLLLFTLLRFVAVPILAVLLSKLVLKDEMMRGVLALMIAVPVGNLPAMLNKQFGKDDSVVAKGIVYTTVLSVLTITVTCMFL